MNLDIEFDRFRESENKELILEQPCEESLFGLPGEVSLRMAGTAAESYFASHQIEDAAVDAWYLLEYVTGISRAMYLADRNQIMSKEQRDAYAALVNQRGAHIPLQHLTGEQEFMGLPFLVSEAVLIPRQDTETLVEMALDKIKAGPYTDAAREKIKMELRSDTVPKNANAYRVLDLCTGSGCIAVSIAKLWEQMQVKQDGGKSDAGANRLEVFASDLSADALAVARENARRLDADVHFFQSDLFAQIPMPADGQKILKSAYGQTENGANGSGYDLIVSNPPYIRTQVIEELSEEVRLYEPRLALDGGTDGLAFYRRIIRESREYLRPGGWLLLEIGYDQGEDVGSLMRENEFLKVRVSKDLAGNDRVVEGVYDV